MKRLLPIIAALSCFAAWADDVPYNAPSAANPIIPGYFADPTIKKFGDTYYIYATTDGSGAGFGPAQLWCSKDFKNWTIMPMNWPDSHWIWAPDVMQNPNDGRYYYIYCQPCQIHVGAGDSPRGPWTNILGESEAVLVPDRFVTNAITLDGQTFIDDDGSIYMYWGTWGIYKGFGCGAGKLAPDMKSFTETRLIPNTEVTDFFEAPFVLKHKGKYYFMYSSGHCEDHSYRVQYAVADKPLGPYKYKGTILSTNDDGTIHGPGHHSVMKIGNDYYIVYHRHDNPHSNRGFHRQIAVDKLIFDKKGNILPIKASHSGVAMAEPSIIKSRDLAYQRPVTASSYYDNDFRPEYAVDDNNGTLWRPATSGNQLEWLQIDLGEVQPVRTVWIQPEYGTHFYQYIIETSKDGKTWEVFADKRNNRLAGSPLVDFGDAQARYVRYTATGGQKAGFPGAVWNIKVFPEIEDANPQQWMGLTAADFDGIEWHNSQGMLGGAFALKQGKVQRYRHQGRDYLMLAPGTVLTYSNPMLSPSSPHTLSAMALRHGTFEPVDISDALSEGKIELRADKEPLLITNLRYYNYELFQPEKDFNAVTDIVRHEPAQTNPLGKFLDISADQFAVGDTVPYFENRGTIGGYFETQRRPLVIDSIDGRKAFRFTGNEHYRSSFPLPATIRDNAPYTIDAWFLNDSIALNECIADLTSSHDELEKIMIVNGTEPRCGVMQHYGWFEDSGYAKVADLAGKWQHLYVCFDGRIETVYINGEQVARKDIQLLVKPSQFISLGLNSEGDWPFTGALHSLKVYDEYIPYEQ